MMHRLPTILCRAVLRQHAARNERAERNGQHIDLVKSQPAAHLALIASQNRLCVAQEMVDESTVLPSAVSGGQMQRAFIMRQGDQRFNPVFMQFIKDRIVKRQSAFIRLGIVPVRENT